MNRLNISPQHGNNVTVNTQVLVQNKYFIGKTIAGDPQIKHVRLMKSCFTHACALTHAHRHASCMRSYVCVCVCRLPFTLGIIFFVFVLRTIKYSLVLMFSV